MTGRTTKTPAGRMKRFCAEKWPSQQFDGHVQRTCCAASRDTTPSGTAPSGYNESTSGSRKRIEKRQEQTMRTKRRTRLAAAMRTTKHVDHHRLCLVGQVSTQNVARHSVFVTQIRPSATSSFASARAQLEQHPRHLQQQRRPHLLYLQR